MKFLERYFGFGLEPDCVVLNCGARIYRLDYDLAQIIQLSRDELDCKELREGDAVLFCRNIDCCFAICPLAKEILSCKSRRDIEEVLDPIVAKGKFVRGEVDLADVDNANGQDRLRFPFARRTVAIAFRNNNSTCIIVPPMLADLGDFPLTQKQHNNKEGKR